MILIQRLKEMDAHKQNKKKKKKILKLFCYVASLIYSFCLAPAKLN